MRDTRFRIWRWLLGDKYVFKFIIIFVYSGKKIKKNSFIKIRGIPYTINVTDPGDSHYFIRGIPYYIATGEYSGNAGECIPAPNSVIRG